MRIRSSAFWLAMYVSLFVVHLRIDGKAKAENPELTRPSDHARLQLDAINLGTSHDSREAMSRLIEDHRFILKALSARLVKSERRPGEFLDTRRINAAYLLGEMRCVDAIPLLIEHVEIENPFDPLFTSLKGYPCALALQKMKDSAFYPIVEYLQSNSKESVSDVAIRLYAIVILTHDEARNDDTEIVLKRVRDRASRRANLDRLFAAIQAIRTERAE